MKKITEAKQIPDEKFLTAIRIVRNTYGWGNRCEVENILSGLLGADIPVPVDQNTARNGTSL